MLLLTSVGVSFVLRVLRVCVRVRVSRRVRMRVLLLVVLEPLDSWLSLLIRLPLAASVCVSSRVRMIVLAILVSRYGVVSVLVWELGVYAKILL